MQKRLRLENIDSESFENLGARLAYLCRDYYGDDAKVELIVAFSERDAGRGNAILWLMKHFGVFPLEMGEPDGKINLHELAKNSPSSGVMLIIQSVPLVKGEHEKENGDQFRASGNSMDSTMVENIKAHIPTLNGLNDSLPKGSVDMLAQQIMAISQLLGKNGKVLIGPIIYLAGFSLIDDSEHAGNLPSSEFIPWYLMVSEENGVRRIYRQPELSEFLRKLPKVNPHIVDLETIISDMGMDPNLDYE